MKSVMLRRASAQRRPLAVGCELPEAGDRHPKHWLDYGRLRAYSIVVLLCYVIVALGYLVFLARHHPDFRPPATDVLPFWSASYLTLHGHAAEAYNMQSITAVELAVLPSIGKMGGFLPWLYPPTALLAAWPLALIPYPWAVVLFLVGSCALFAGTVRAIVRRPEAGWMALAFPGAALVVAMGQNALLTAGLAGLGLHWLRRYPVASGICFGLLSMKPHLAVLFPLALLCSRSWRALAACALTLAATLALALLAFGAATYSSFLHATSVAAGYVESAGAFIVRIPTLFALARMMHASISVSYAVQGISLATAVVAVCITWGRECPYSLRAATLACASLLVSPYLHDYDLAWYGIVIAWYCRYSFARGWRRGEREWLCLLWLAPILGVLVVGYVRFQFLALFAPVTLWMLIRRAREARFAPIVLTGDPDE